MVSANTHPFITYNTCEGRVDKQATCVCWCVFTQVKENPDVIQGVLGSHYEK